MFVSFSFRSMRHGNRFWQRPQVRRLVGENGLTGQRLLAASCHIQVGDQREVTARRDTLIWVSLRRRCPSRAATLTQRLLHAHAHVRLMPPQNTQQRAHTSLVFNTATCWPTCRCKTVQNRLPSALVPVRQTAVSFS